MSHLVREIKGVSYHYGGEEHSGWLPPGAAKPLPTPIRRLVLNLRIEQLEGGECLLLIESQDGSLSADDWYHTLQAALEGAEQRFGVLPSEWDAPA